MILETSRLILRPFQESDAESLYRYAKDPRVGPNAGWLAHTSVEDSRQTIQKILSAEGTYAVIPKEQNEAVGSIGLITGEKRGLAVAEAEIGYWIGVPYWGKGLIPEAMRELMRYAFEDLGMNTLWCQCYDENDKSKRVMEKCGFRYHHMEEKEAPLLGVIKTMHVTHITRAEWKAQ